MITTNHPTGPDMLADDGLWEAATAIGRMNRADLFRLPRSLFEARQTAASARELGSRARIDVLCVDMAGHIKLRRFGPRGGTKTIFDFGRPVSDATGCAVLAA